MYISDGWSKQTHRIDFVKNTTGKRTADVTNYFLVPFRVRCIGSLLHVFLELLASESRNGDLEQRDAAVEAEDV